MTLSSGPRARRPGRIAHRRTPRHAAWWACAAAASLVLSGCSTAIGRPAAPVSGPSAGGPRPIGLSEAVPAARSAYSYEPAATWRPAASGSGDTLRWEQASTGCTLSLLSMADPRPTFDGARSRELVRGMSKSDTGKDTPGPAVVLPSENERPIEFAQRQTVGAKDYTGYAARAFTRSGGLLAFQLDCPASRARPDLLATTLAEGTLIHVA